MRLLFGALLALLMLCPALVEPIAAIAVHPAVIAFFVGVWAWPRITKRIKGWIR
ncbi:hypothetical protein [Streptomyces cadmiisoli]|uniref:hypothetical protein n=1 Tax=Streptomyces cadmiisoli TaxID=2184053 RepID=UPI003666E131